MENKRPIQTFRDAERGAIAASVWIRKRHPLESSTT